MPDELVEAAKVDGANAWQTVRHVLVPALRRPLVVVGVVSVIFALRTFDIVYVMTGGGPAQDTMVLALLLWQQAFAFLDTPQGGQATAIAVLMSAVLVVGSWPVAEGAAGGRSPMTAVGRSRWMTFLLYGSITVLAVVWLVPMLSALDDRDPAAVADPRRLVEPEPGRPDLRQLRPGLGPGAVPVRGQQLRSSPSWPWC